MIGIKTLIGFLLAYVFTKALGADMTVVSNDATWIGVCIIIAGMVANSED